MRVVEHLYGQPAETLLAELLGRHGSVRGISNELGVGYATAWRWLVHFGLSTPYMDQKEQHRRRDRRGRPAAHVVTVNAAEATTLVLPESVGRVHFPIGSLPPETFVTPTLLAKPSHPTGSLLPVGPYVELHAVDAKTGAAVPAPFPAPYSLTLAYHSSALLDAHLKPEQLGFYFLDPQTLRWMPDASTINWSDRTASVQLDHMTEFALLADVTPPTTRLALDGSRGPDGAYAGAVSVTLAAQDAAPGSGVAMTYYQVVRHGGPAPSSALPGSWRPYQSPFAVREAGDWDVYAFSVDNASNAEAVTSLGRVRLLPPMRP